MLLLSDLQVASSRASFSRSTKSWCSRRCDSRIQHGAAQPSAVLPRRAFKSCKRATRVAATSSDTKTETLNTVELENVNRDYCDDFVCTSSPAIETTVKAFSRDIQRFRYTMSLLSNDVEYSDGVRSFKGKDRYLRPNWISANMKDAKATIVRMVMLDKGSAEITWRLTGSLYNLPLDVDITTIIQLQLLTGRIDSQKEQWSFSRCSPPATAAVFGSKLVWSASQVAADGSESVNKALDSFSSMDEDNSSVYSNPQDPTKFFQQQDTRLPDFIALATVVSALYFIFKTFEAIETLK